MHKNTKELVKNIRYRLSDFNNQAKDKDDKTIKLKNIVKTDHIICAINNAINIINYLYNLSLNLDNCKKYNTLVQLYAASEIMLSKSLLERGREFTVSDVGVSYQPPSIAEMLFSQGLSDRDLFFKILKGEFSAGII